MIEELPTIEELFNQVYKYDPLLKDILQQLQDGKIRSKQLSLVQYTVQEGRLFYRDSLYIPYYIPLKLRLIQDFHATPAAGHPGRSKTFELLTRHYYWPKMHKDVD